MVRWKPSVHLFERLAERHLTGEHVDYVLRYGCRVRRTGVTFYVLRRCDIPRDDLRLDCFARLEGAIALVARDGTVITMYVNKDALIDIRKKMKHRLPDRTRRLPRRRLVTPEVETTPEDDEE